MNKKVIIVISLLVGGIGIGIGITYYFSPDIRKESPYTNSSKEIAENLNPGTMTINKNTVMAPYGCPCGKCSKRLIDCKCVTAKEIDNYVISLIDKALPADEIKKEMVKKYGLSLVEGKVLIPPYYESVDGIELPNTLDPQLVSSEAREAYSIAKEYPELLMQIPCFCGCEVERSSRGAHKSLLDCFTDRHGENCRICMNEAMYAKDKIEQGVKTEEIRNVIIKERGYVRL